MMVREFESGIIKIYCECEGERTYGKTKRIYIRGWKGKKRTYIPIGYYCPKCKKVVFDDGIPD